MRFTLEINMNNASFEYSPGHELSRILTETAQLLAELDSGCIGDQGTLRDSNGNTVGFWEVVE